MLLTGDIVTPRAGVDPLPLWPEVTAPMVSRQIPWAAVLGNHDDEWKHHTSRPEIPGSLERLAGSVTQCGPVELGSGGNYILTIKSSDSNQPAAVLYCLDSRAYSSNLKLYGLFDWFSFDQISWYRQQSRQLTEAHGGTPLPALAFFHIPLPEFKQAATVSLGHCPEFHGPMLNSGMFTAMVASRDVMGTFVGHDHLNDYAGYSLGLCLGYGRKTGSTFAAYGHPLPSGARVIELTEGKRDFETWICAADGTTEFCIQYPDGFIALEKEKATKKK